MAGMIVGIVILAGLVIAVTLVVIEKNRDSQRRRLERRQRFAVEDTRERIAMAPASPPPAPRPMRGTPIFGDDLPPLVPAEEPTRVAAEAEDQIEPLIPGFDDDLASPVVGMRLVETPEGEMVLTDPPFAMRPALLTERERAFAAAISRKLSKRFLLCPKVRLDAFLVPTSPDGRDPADWREWRRRVRVRQVDFLICDSAGYRPVVILMMEPASVGATTIGGGRDAMIEEVAHHAGLTVVRCSGRADADWPLVESHLAEGGSMSSASSA